MYENFYNLTEKPFNLTPSPRFLYMSEGHKEALALLKYGVLERKGFILLTGEVGTGKTTMVRALLDNLDKSVFYVHMSNPLLSPQEFINYLAYSTFKKESYFNAKAKFLLAFREFLQRCLLADKNFNLIIDEAHKLSFELLEEIRLLSNLETGDKKLMNIFLVGQPELNEKLCEMRSRPLLQRISIRYNILPLNIYETRRYMETRLNVAGASDIDDIFMKSAVKSVYRYTQGYPREINILADNALLLGYSMGVRKITPSMIKSSYEDLKLDRSFNQIKFRKSRLPKIKRTFSPPLRLWKAACIILLITVIPVFASSRQGKETFSKLKSLFLQSSQTSYSPILSVPDASRSIVSQQIKDLPEMKPSDTTPYTTKTNGTNLSNKNDLTNSLNLTNQTDKNNNTNQQVPLNALPSSTEEDGQVFEDVPEIASSELDISTNETNQTNQTNEVVETNEIIVADETKEVNKTNETNETKKRNSSDWKTITVKSGDILSKLIAEAYGSVDSEKISFVKAHNPEIADVNKIEIGQKIFFPPLSIDMEKIE